MQSKNIFYRISKILLVGSFLSFLLATILSGFPILAFIWNVAFPQTSAELSQVLSAPISASTQAAQFEITSDRELPPKDPSLPETPSITIKKIGVETPIHEQPLETYEEALRKGVWRVPNFGTPLDTEKPIILVAHRFGYLNWEQNFRLKNSFYNLPKLETGDRIEIIWDQRKFIYEIYQKEEATDISHYSADLILYTCRFLNSDIRIFRYARLL